MSSSAIAGPAGSVHAVLTSALQKVGLVPGTPGGPVPVDSSHVSPLGQVLNALQQLQQSNPADYRHVSQQIAASLKNAAQAAESAGNTGVASQLTGLANDFTNASASG
jgi:hypothetical protein